ncbi:MAG: CoA transferase [Pseudomonadota bacterium]
MSPRYTLKWGKCQGLFEMILSLYSVGEPGMTPLLAQFGITDQATAIMASYQVVIVLLMRERFGIAQKVETSILGTTSYLLYLNNLTTLLTGKEADLLLLRFLSNRGVELFGIDEALIVLSSAYNQCRANSRIFSPDPG